MKLWVACACALLVTRAAATESAYVRAGDQARTACGAAPSGWQEAAFDDSSWANRPIALADGGVLPGVPPSESPASNPGTTATADGGVVASCAGTRYARWHFTVGAERTRLATITLRIRYTHGFVAWLNGVEIARRRLDPGATVANDVHGPEADRLIVPVGPGLLRDGANVLAIEVHPRTAGRETTLEAALFGDDGPRIIRGPYLVNVSESDATVVVESDLPTTAELRWGPTAAYGASASDGAGTHHVLRLRALKPGTIYHYRVLLRAAPDGGDPPNARLAALVLDSDDSSFHSAPDAGRALRFAVYGDVRSGHDIHAELNRALADEEPDLAILTGDLVDRGSDEGDWERFFEVATPLLRRLTIFPAIGNHEYARLGKGADVFMQLFRLPNHPAENDVAWYSFDVAGAHFVALDSNQYRSPRQLAWFERDLREARRRGARAIFVYAHEGPFSSGMHGDNSVCQRDYVPLMEANHVAMLFTGHDHDYERGRAGALDYVVTGGGGAELRAPRCGVPGKRPCATRVISFSNEHNYVMVELMPAFFRVCPKRVDGTPIEACSEYPLKGAAP